MHSGPRASLAIIAFASALFGLGTAPCLAASPAPTQAQAQLLDHAEMLCDNCFFGASKYFYCFAADNKILIGYQKTPVLNWQDPSKNYFTPVRPKWAAWGPAGETMPIAYDPKHIWVARPEGASPHGFWSNVKAFAIWSTRGKSKKVRLTRSSMGDIFKDARCQAAAPRKAQ
jgi:hypothetical protein